MMESKKYDNNDLFEIINENSRDMIALIDENFNFEYINERAHLEIIGYTKNDLIGKPSYEHTHLDDLKRGMKELRKGLKSGAGSAEVRYKHKKGHYIWMEIRGRTFKTKEGKSKIFAITREITKRKEIEQELEESKEKYQNIIENTNEGYFEVDLKGNFIFFNDAFTKLIGYDKKEIINSNYSKYMTNENAKKTFQTFNKVYRAEIAEKSFRYEIIAKSGETLFGESSVYLRYDSKGKKIGFAGFIRNITEQKKTEKKLKESEEKYRLITENANDLIRIVDKNFKNEYINELTHLRLLGYSKEDLIKKTARDLYHPEEVEQVNKYLRYVIKTGEGRREGRIKHKNGQWIWFDMRAKLIKNDRGDLKGLVISREITERKKTEFKLRESEEKYHLITENANDLIAVMNDKFEYEYINESVHKRIIGYSNEDVIGLSALKLIHPDDLKMSIKKLGDSFKKDGSEDMAEVRLRHKDGHWMWFEVRGRTFIDTDGKLKGLTISRVIDDRKRAEQMMKESEKKYRLITENANDLIGILNKKFKYEYINEQAFLQILGYSSVDLIGKSPLKFCHPKDIEQTATALFEGFKQGLGEAVLRFKHKEGHWVWLEAKGKTFLDKDGDLKSLVVSRDITERKIAEQKLKKSEEKYRLISENANDLIAIINDKLEYEYVNEQPHFDILGYSKEDLIGKRRLDIINPKDFKRGMNAFRTGFKSGVSSGEYRLKHKRGHYLWLDMKGTTITDKSGNKKGIIIARDITERKETEKKLKESEEKYRKIFNASPDFILLTNIEGEILDANQSLLNRTCLSLNKIRRKNFVDLFMEDYSLDLKTKKTEVRGKLLTGETYEFEIIGIPLEEEGKTSRVLHLIRDITSQKKLEKNLLEVSRLKSELMDRASHELKTPLISIKGFSDLLLEVYSDKLDDDIINIVEEVKRGCERLEKLINDILEGSRLESGQVKLKLNEEDLGFLIRYCVNDLKMLLKMRKQRVSLKLDDFLICKIEKERLYDVINNLLTNAIKFSPPDTEIEISSEINDDYIVISVKDKGIGLTDDEKNYIFRHFGKIERYGQGWDVGIEGTGLGLYIAKKILELHGGKIWVESEGRNKGSTFFFCLPKC